MFLLDLAPFGPKSEWEAVFKRILEAYFGFSYAQQLLHLDDELSERELQDLTQMVTRLRNHEPIQYILNHEVFYDLPFKLNQSVLIPRPETEELVTKVIQDLGTKFNGKILDLGTGSGCIAIALKKHLPNAQITGWDISEKALEVAKENALNNEVTVEFEHKSIDSNWDNSWDVVVSNPPYIGLDEKNEMGENVLKHEPNEALFVEDQHPTYFYRQIANRVTLGQKKARIYLELNPKYAGEIKTYYHEKGFTDLKIYKDLNEKERMLSAKFELIR